MNKVTIALLALAVVLAAVGAYFWFWWSPYGRIITGPGFEGLLMSPLPKASVKHWVVPAEQIVEMESRLTQFVADHPALFNADIPVQPEAYRRHYGGIERDGRSFIHVTLYRKGFVPRRDWLNGVTVSGGAAHDNWSVRYYPDSQSFSNLYPFPIQRMSQGRQQ
jgi:hypothetical protein